MDEGNTNRREFFCKLTGYTFGAAAVGVGLGKAHNAHQAHKPIHFSVGTRAEHRETDIQRTPELLHLLHDAPALQQKLDGILCAEPSAQAALRGFTGTLRADISHAVKPRTDEARAAVTEYLVHQALSKAISRRDGKAVDILKGTFGDFDALAKSDSFIGFISDCYRQQAMSAGMEGYFPETSPPREREPFPFHRKGPGRGIES